MTQPKDKITPQDCLVVPENLYLPGECPLIKYDFYGDEDEETPHFYFFPVWQAIRNYDDWSPKEKLTFLSVCIAYWHREASENFRLNKFKEFYLCHQIASEWGNLLDTLTKSILASGE